MRQAIANRPQLCQHRTPACASGARVGIGEVCIGWAMTWDDPAIHSVSRLCRVRAARRERTPRRTAGPLEATPGMGPWAELRRTGIEHCGFRPPSRASGESRVESLDIRPACAVCAGRARGGRPARATTAGRRRDARDADWGGHARPRSAWARAGPGCVHIRSSENSFLPHGIK